MARVSRKLRSDRPVSSPQRVYQAALYARLSVEDNGTESDSLENQISMMKDYVSHHPDLNIQGVYADNGFTGTNFLRPQWQTVMEAAQSGKINCIIVKDLSRLGRNYIETGNFLEKVCPFLNLRFISITNDLDTAKAGSSEQLAAAIHNIINDSYAKDISRKITSAMESKMRNGDFIGNWAPYGYLRDPENKNHLIVDPETAVIVRRMYEMRSTGMSYDKINRTLNEAGILSPSQLKAVRGIKTNNNQKSRPVLWNRHMTKEILTNVLYIGHMAQRRTSQCLYAGIPFHQAKSEDWIIAENTHEPIVSQALFDAVQSVNQETTRKYKQWQGKYDHLPKAKNIYSKRFICADCGAVMKLHRSFSRERDKVYFTFNCPTYVEHGSQVCASRKIRKGDLDESVLQAVKAQICIFLDTQELFEQLSSGASGSRSDEPSREIAQLEKQISKKKASYTETYLDLKSGLLNKSEFHRIRSLLEQEIQALENRLRDLTAAAAELSAAQNTVGRWNTVAWDYLSAKEVTPALLDCMIEQIRMNADGSLSIRFRFEAELERIHAACERLQKEELSYVESSGQLSAALP